MEQRFRLENAEGVRVGRVGKAINTHCILYRLGTTVIDTGPFNQWPRVRRFLQEKPLTQVLLTHHHEDHAGNGAQIIQNFQVPIYIHPQGISACQSGYSTPLIQKVIWGGFKPFSPLSLRESYEVEKGVTLIPIHAPGHTADLVCFLVPEKGWLITGDLFIARQPKYMHHQENVGQQITTLETILTHDFDTLLCSHRGIVKDGKEALCDKRDYLISLREAVAYHLERGETTRTIRKILLGKEGMMGIASGFTFSKMNLIHAFAKEYRAKEKKVA